MDAPITPGTKVTRGGRSVYSLRLSAEELGDLYRLAEQAGMAPSALVRSWIVEHTTANDATGGLRRMIRNEVRVGVTQALRQAAS
jgi:hypothetical protein